MDIQLDDLLPDAEYAVLLLVDKRAGHRNRNIAKQEQRQAGNVFRLNEATPWHPRPGFGQPRLAFSQLDGLHLPLSRGIRPAKVNAAHANPILSMRISGVLCQKGQRSLCSPVNRQIGRGSMGLEGQDIDDRAGGLRSLRWRITPCIRNIGARVFTANRWSNNATSAPATEPRSLRPAALTSPSSLPNLSIAAEIILAGASCSSRLAATKAALAPSFNISEATSAPRCL